MLRLTKTAVENLSTKSKPYFVFDLILTGFCVRISMKGKRNYYLQYEKMGRKKRINLGLHGTITTEQARRKATILLGDITKGIDPHEQKVKEYNVLTIVDLAHRFLQEHVMMHCKPSTQRDYQSRLRAYIVPFFREMKVPNVTRADVSAFHHSLSHSPFVANTCLRILSKMFNLAETWGLRGDNTNPCRHVKKYPEKKRERYLSEEELKRLSAVLEEAKTYLDENLSAVYCIQLLLLTGCRLGEIRTLKWKYSDAKQKILRLPDSKTGAKVVYVGETVLSLLEEIRSHPSRPKDNPYVIWGRKPDTYLMNVRKPWCRFCKMAGLEDIRIHDLRHSFASFAVSKGMSLPMLGKLLGHTQPQTTARYAHLMAKPMTEAATQVTDVIGDLMGIKKKPFSKEGEKEVKNPIVGTNIERPTWLSPEQAAHYLGVKKRVLYDWRYNKGGPKHTKIAGRIRYDLEDIKAFVQR